VAEGAGYPGYLLRAVDLPEEAIAVRAIPRDSEWETGAPLVNTPSPVLSGADTGNVSPVSATSAVVRLVASTEDTSGELAQHICKREQVARMSGRGPIPQQKALSFL